MPIDQLPTEQFNVVVENDMDEARLLWLVNQVGEVKLRKSIAKYQSSWLGSKPFVSTLLKLYKLKVPPAIYAEIRIPVYWLYLLCKCDGSEVKVGMTGNWPWRSYAHVPRDHQIADIYDFNRSVAFLVGGSKAEARRRETAIKREFSSWRSRSEDGWNNCYTEWFAGDRLDDMVKMASSFEDQKDLVVQTLGRAIELHCHQDFQTSLGDN